MIDQGSTREPNQQSTISRATHFNHWARQHGFLDFTFESTPQEAAGGILVTYTQEIAEGLDLKNTTPVRTRGSGGGGRLPTSCISRRTREETSFQTKACLVPARAVLLTTHCQAEGALVRAQLFSGGFHQQQRRWRRGRGRLSRIWRRI